MRFKAKLATWQVELLNNIITPISRFTGNGRFPGHSSDTSSIYHSPFCGGGGAVIHLDPNYLRISARGGGTSTGGGSGTASTTVPSTSTISTVANDAEGIACFTEVMTTNGIFMEHRIESIADNVIVFEISLAQLRMALQSILASGKSSEGTSSSGNIRPLHNSSSNIDTDQNEENARLSSLTLPGIVMKLAKRNRGFPFLCLDSQVQGKGSIEVHHAIPVRIMRAADMQYHLPPRISMPDVQLELPHDRSLRAVVERLRSLSPHVYIEGSMAGELTLRVDGDGASIQTFYNKLVPRFEDCKSTTGRDGQNDENDEPVRCTLKVDSKKLNACLQWQGTLSIGKSISSAVLCLVENEMLVLHVMLNPSSVGFFTYYVPVHYLSED
mmetsp:Transcript_2605/g.3687  ORF Transcript_2605/g.3687 Transcript_2605/m.3687 type:complete len:384 (+) Transcript_2605:33-1184(+)